MQPENIESLPEKWWGAFSIECGEVLVCEIGATRYFVQRRESEWLVAHEVREGGEQSQWVLSRGGEPDDECTGWERFVFQRTEPALLVEPALAGRSIVSRPATPFSLQPGEEAEIFVSSPLWVRIKVHRAGTELTEFPLVPLSDTWLGSSTLDGELCYATRTHARLLLDAIPRQVHRATTPVRLVNRADKPLMLERLNLPVPYLGVFHRAEGDLWTEAINLVRERDSDMAELKIVPGPPKWVAGGKRITAPREKMEDGLLVRAFGALFT